MKRIIVLFMTLMLLTAVGCRGGGTAPAPPAVPTAVPTAAPEPLPTTAAVTESSYALVIRAWEEEGVRYVELDYVNVVRHQADELAEDGAPYGYAWLEIRNYNTDTRIFPVADWARFCMSTDPASPKGSFGPVEWEYFASNAAGLFAVYEVEYPTYFHVRIVDSELASANFWYEYYLPSIN